MEVEIGKVGSTVDTDVIAARMLELELKLSQDTFNKHLCWAVK